MRSVASSETDPSGCVFNGRTLGISEEARLTVVDNQLTQSCVVIENEAMHALRSYIQV